MKSKLIGVALLLACIVPGTIVLGQQAQTDDSRIRQLEATIEKLEAVDRDPATLPEVRKLNSEFLKENRQLLRSLVDDRIGALNRYLVTFRDILTPSQVQTVEATIAKLKEESTKTPVAESGDLGGSNRGPSAAAVGSTSTRSDAPTARAASNESTNGNAAAPVVRSTESPRLNAPVALATAAVVPQGNPPFKEFPAPQDCATYNANKASFSLYEQYVCTMIEQMGKNKAAGNPLIEPHQETGFDLMIILTAQKLRSEFLVDAEEARVDKQVGAPSSSAGSTSLVTKGGTPAILGFAVENGALAQEINGTTVTFRGNPVGLIDAFKNKGFISGFDDDTASTRLLRKASFAFTFDTSRGDDPGVFTARKQQLSSFSGRIEFINKRDPRGNDYKTDWENFFATRAQPFLAATVLFKSVLTELVPGTGEGLVLAQFRYKDRVLQEWYVATQAALANVAPANFETVVKAQLAKLPIEELSPETVTALTNVARQFGAFVEGRQRILDRVAKGTVATFEYTNKREVAAPDTSNFLGIYETAFGKDADFTFNGSLTLFNKLPTGPNARRVRDFQFAGQLDLPFGDVNGAGQFVLSASAKYERLMQAASPLTGVVLPNVSGDIAVGQVKLTVPIKGLGIKLPISLSFANRTELIKEKEVRGNFGFTFDLDTIFAKFKPF